MKLLLDTHAFIWAVSEPGKLSRKAAAAIIDGENELFVSAVSFWEIAIKIRLGKLQPVGIDHRTLVDAAKSTGIGAIPLDAGEAESSHQLTEDSHFDPFDRMLVWQAITRKLTLVSADSILKRFDADGLKLLW
jgi:PIN domain nuclease of toxin-antitoxin system